MNVLYLIRTWAFGGSHTILLSLLEHLPRERFNIICVPYDAHSAGDAEFIERANARGIVLSDERIRWRSGRDWFRARRQVFELIRGYNIDLVHTHDPHSNVMIGIGIGRGRWPVPVVASAYGWWDGALGRRRIHQRLERDYALPNFDRVITVSDDMRNRILEGPTPPERVRVVHTGLPAPPPEEYGQLHARFNIPEDAIIVGTIGRVSAEKGHRYLLEAAAKLDRETPDVYFVIVGTGPELESLKQQAAQLGLTDRVAFTGFWDDLHAALADFDLFVFPSVEREGLPTAILEAQRSGTPVVASDIGGTREALAHRKTGILVEPANADALAEALRDLISYPESRSLMGNAAAKWAAENFKLDAMIDSISAFYDECIQEYGHARRD